MLKGRRNLGVVPRQSFDSSKHGFTLIETILAVGILVILVVIMYQGFASTLQISANTAKFEQAGNVAVGKANVTVAATTGNPLVPSVMGIKFGTYDKKLGICVFRVTGVPNTNFGDSQFKETLNASTNRSGFYYSGTTLTP